MKDPEEDGREFSKLNGEDGDERRGAKRRLMEKEDGVVWETTRRKHPEVICVGLGLVSPRRPR